jgi:hypothetical protein
VWSPPSAESPVSPNTTTNLDVKTQKQAVQALGASKAFQNSTSTSLQKPSQVSLRNSSWASTLATFELVRWRVSVRGPPSAESSVSSKKTNLDVKTQKQALQASRAFENTSCKHAYTLELNKQIVLGMT